MKHTKWEFIRPYIDKPITIETRIKGNRWEKIATISMMNERAQLPNAELIVSAVNACIKLNPENPLAIAESIKDMYEIVERVTKLVSHTPGDSQVILMATQVLAKIKGG